MINNVNTEEHPDLCACLLDNYDSFAKKMPRDGTTYIVNLLTAVKLIDENGNRPEEAWYAGYWMSSPVIWCSENGICGDDPTDWWRVKPVEKQVTVTEWEII